MPCRTSPTAAAAGRAQRPDVPELDESVGRPRGDEQGVVGGEGDAGDTLLRVRDLCDHVPLPRPGHGMDIVHAEAWSEHGGLVGAHPRVEEEGAPVPRPRGDDVRVAVLHGNALHTPPVARQRAQPRRSRNVPQTRGLIARAGQKLLVQVSPGHVKDRVVVRPPLASDFAAAAASKPSTTCRRWAQYEATAVDRAPASKYAGRRRVEDRHEAFLVRHHHGFAIEGVLGEGRAERRHQASAVHRSYVVDIPAIASKVRRQPSHRGTATSQRVKAAHLAREEQVGE